MRFLTLCLGLLLIAGCKPSEPQSGKKGGGSDIIDTMTQKNKADLGRRARDKIEEIDEERDRDIESAMGEW